MGATRDDFVKYPRTPHLFGSRGTDDDKHLSAKESARFVDDDSLIVEEKLDGTNTGIHFHSQGRMILQCRGHEIKSGMHPQYDLFKQWTMGKRPVLEAMLSDRFILFGEWRYAKHSVHYRALPHYFFEFDIYDKSLRRFLDLDTRLRMLDGTDVRSSLDVEPTDDQGEVVQVAREWCREHLRAKRDFAFNATNSMRLTRTRWIDLFADYNARIEIVYLEPSLKVLHNQNENRAKAVPRRAIERLIAKLEPPTQVEAHRLTFRDE